MIRETVRIVNRLGMHARAAAKLATLASQYPCEVQVASNGHQVNGKSIMGLMMLAATKGTDITLQTEGEGETEAMNALVELVRTRFGEAE